MSTLRFLCLACERVYQTLEVTRDLDALDTSHGYCPECAPRITSKAQGLHGVVVGRFEKRWCRCGREIVTGKGVCEFCETAGLVLVPADFDVEEL